MDGLKQRIIGALVLVSLAVIFVPMMFDEPHSERQASEIEIPEEPPFPEVEMPEPDQEEPPQYHLEEMDTGDSPNDTSEPMGQQSEPQSTTTEEQAARASESQPAAANQTEESEASQPEADNEPVTAEFTRSLEGAWVVQLGSFGSDENASRLSEKVREKGYSSHLQRITRGETQLTRVFSGPFAEKAEAEKAKQALDKAFGLNSLVTSGGK